MTVDQTDVIDVASISKSTGEVMLTISDHLDRTNTIEHQTVLQGKFNTYLAFVESGEIFEWFPDAKSRPVVFNVVLKFKPDKDGDLFLHRAGKVIESTGFRFQYEVFADSYDN